MYWPALTLHSGPTCPVEFRCDLSPNTLFFVTLLPLWPQEIVLVSTVSPSILLFSFRQHRLARELTRNQLGASIFARTPRDELEARRILIAVAEGAVPHSDDEDDDEYDEDDEHGHESGGAYAKSQSKKKHAPYREDELDIEMRAATAEWAAKRQRDNRSDEKENEDDGENGDGDDDADEDDATDSGDSNAEFADDDDDESEPVGGTDAAVIDSMYAFDDMDEFVDYGDAASASALSEDPYDAEEKAAAAYLGDGQWDLPVGDNGSDTDDDENGEDQEHADDDGRGRGQKPEFGLQPMSSSVRADANDVLDNNGDEEDFEDDDDDDDAACVHANRSGSSNHHSASTSALESSADPYARPASLSHSRDFVFTRLLLKVLAGAQKDILLTCESADY